MEPPQSSYDESLRDTNTLSSKVGQGTAGSPVRRRRREGINIQVTFEKEEHIQTSVDDSKDCFEEERDDVEDDEEKEQLESKESDECKNADETVNAKLMPFFEKLDEGVCNIDDIRVLEAVLQKYDDSSSLSHVSEVAFCLSNVSVLFDGFLSFFKLLSAAKLKKVEICGLNVADEDGIVRSKLFWSAFRLLDLKSIQILSIIECGLDYLDEKCIRSCLNLRNLTVAGNNLSEFPVSVSFLLHLEALSLKRNTISNISETIEFQKLNRLKLIDLRDNPSFRYSKNFEEFLLLTTTCKFRFSKNYAKRIYSGKRHRVPIQKNMETELVENEMNFQERRVPSNELEVELQRSSKKLKEELPQGIACSQSYLSGYLDFEELLVDGFCDGGRNPSANIYFDSQVPLESSAKFREVILVDKMADQRLSKLAEEAKALVSHIDVDDVRVKLLALFVSDAMGGRQDFISSGDSPFSWKDSVLFQVSESQIRELAQSSKSTHVLLGSVTHGVCRHRAILFKYLADSLNPRLPVALVRGYRGTTPHVWNLVKINRSEFILDCLDTPHVLYPVSEQYIANPVWNSLYFPQYQSFQHSKFSKTILQAQMGGILGKGCNSSVFTCYIADHQHQNINKLCAVKVTELTNFCHEAAARAFQELPLIGHLEHPNIVRCLGYHIEKSACGRVHLKVFMEFIHGCSLRQLIEKFDGNMTSVDILAVMLQISKALRFLHSKGFLHRDIKSENIMVSASRPLEYESHPDDSDIELALSQLDSEFSRRPSKICDLSNIVYIHEDPCTLEVFGTLHWSAPEVVKTLDPTRPTIDCNSIAQFSRKTDCYSLGVVLYEMLSGTIPFESASPDKIYYLITSDFLKKESESLLVGCCDEVRKRLINLLCRMIDQNPLERLSASEIVSELCDITLLLKQEQQSEASLLV